MRQRMQEPPRQRGLSCCVWATRQDLARQAEELKWFGRPETFESLCCPWVLIQVEGAQYTDFSMEQSRRVWED